MSPTFSALAVRNYRLYFAAMLAGNTGTWMQRIAQDWLVLTLTGGSGVTLGLTLALQFAPTLIFSLVGGTLADRMRRRNLLLITQATMGALAVALGLLALQGQVTVPIVYAFSLALGIVSAVDNPARQAFVSEMVGREHLTNAVALNSATFNLGRIVGPSVAGLMIAVIGTAWVFLLNGVMFAVAVFLVWCVRTSELRAPMRDEDRANARFSDGVTYLQGRVDLILVLVVTFAVGTFGFNFPLTLGLMANQEFHGSAAEFGAFSTALAAGGLIGSLLAARRGSPRLDLVIGAALVFAVLEIASAFMPTSVSFGLFLPLVGVAALTFSNSAQSFVQLRTAPRMRGRMLGFYLLVFFGGTPIGAPLLGLLGDQLGPRWTLGLGGVGVILIAGMGALLLRRRALRIDPAALENATPRPRVRSEA